MKKYSLIITLVLAVSLVLTACNSDSAATTKPAKTESTKPESSETEPAETESSSDANSGSESAPPSDSTPSSSDANPYNHLDFSFSSEDIYGSPVTSEVFNNADLTLLNIFATWCPPCVEEMPHLSALNTEFADKGFQIIGFCTDLRNAETGGLDEEAIATAKDLFSGVNSSYPYIIPDETFLGGILFVQYFPTSVFIDKNGKMLGEPVIGANSYEGWKEEITKRLEGLK